MMPEPKKYPSCTAPIGEYCSKHSCIHKLSKQDGEKRFNREATSSAEALSEKSISSPPSCITCFWNNGCKKTKKACRLFQGVDMRWEDSPNKVKEATR